MWLLCRSCSVCALLCPSARASASTCVCGAVRQRVCVCVYVLLRRWGGYWKAGNCNFQVDDHIVTATSRRADIRVLCKIDIPRGQNLTYIEPLLNPYFATNVELQTKVCRARPVLWARGL